MSPFDPDVEESVRAYARDLAEFWGEPEEMVYQRIRTVYTAYADCETVTAILHRSPWHRRVWFRIRWWMVDRWRQ